MEAYKITGLGEGLVATVKLMDEQLYKDLVTIHGYKDIGSVMNELAEHELLFKLVKKHGMMLMPKEVDAEKA